MGVRVILSVVVGTLALAAPAAAQQDTGAVPMPDVRGPIKADAVGSGSRDYPFGAAEQDLAAQGYVEEEYFFSGTTPVGDYTSRMVVRRPVDEARSSGVVLAEWANVSSGYDLDALWMRSADHVMRERDTYISIDAQDVGINKPQTGLKAYSPKRYADLHIPALAKATYADGGAFDIYGQALRAIRNGAVTGGAPPKLLFPTGTSQSALTLYIYAQTFDFAHQLTDGFLITAATTSTLNQDGQTSVGLPTVPRVPVMWLNTETDYSFHGAPDNSKFRTWEVAGTTHLDHDAIEYEKVFLKRDLGKDFHPIEGCQYRMFSRIPFKYAQNAVWRR